MNFSRARTIGRKYTVIYGPRIDAPTVESKLKEMKLSATAEQVQEIVKKVAVDAIAKRKMLSEEEFSKIAKSLAK